MNTGKILNMMKEARELFDSHDSNHDGKIEKKRIEINNKGYFKKIRFALSYR